ncbi:MAG: CRISPR-associated protein [Promethearchaeia archaeon]
MVNLENTDIEKRSEILYLYDAKDCDPNGDPFTGEPRYDEDRQKVMVSDVRLKRYIRDYTDKHKSGELEEDNNSNIVFYSSLGETQTVEERKSDLKELIDEDNPVKSILSTCVDIRLFGCVLAIKGNNIDLTGTVQFKNMNRSINKVELKPLQNTSVMKSGEEKTQGAIATSSQVPYALISAIGYINPKTAQFNGTKKEDIDLMIESLWNQVNLINTRSKAGQNSRALFKINYSDAISKISDIEDLINIDATKKETEYRNFKEIEPDLDFSDMISVLSRNEDILDSVEYKIDESREYNNLEGFLESLQDKGIKTNKIRFDNEN